MSTNIRRLTEAEKERLNESLSKYSLRSDGGSVEDDTLHIEIRSTGGHDTTFNMKNVLKIIKTSFPNYKILLNGTLTTA